MIRPVSESDAAAIAAIYNHYIVTSHATFELEPVTVELMAGRIKAQEETGLPWLVYQHQNGTVAGYAYAGRWKERLAYRNSVEVTVYLDKETSGQGIGSRLYEALFDVLKKQGLHAALAGIALPNEASVALHEKFGMHKVAHLAEVGRKFDRWVDVGYWQRLL